MAAPIALHNLWRSPNKSARSCSKRTIKYIGIHTGFVINPSRINETAEIKSRCLTYVKNSRVNVAGSVAPCWNINRMRGVCISTSSHTPSILYNYKSTSPAFYARRILGTSCSKCFLTVRKLSLPICTSFLLGLGCHDRRSYCSVSKTCWSCNAQTKLAVKSEVLFFCDVCNAIQPVNPDSNYFQTMQCDKTFDINTAQLTQTFRNLQRKLHPDKFSIMSKEEQGYSAMQSSEVNKAYSTLLKPLSRGLYLLELNGLTIEEGDSGIEVEFLMEVMETNEKLAETRDEETIRKIGAQNAVKLQAFLKDLSQAFSQKNYPQAREILMRLKYFSNIDDKVKEKLEKGF